MLVFWLSIVALCLVTIWALWRPLQSQSTLKMESVQERNIAIAQERALEIESLFEAGELNATEHDQAKHDLELALADELASSHELKDQFTSTPKSSHYFILALIPLLAYASYSVTTNYNPDAANISMQAQDGKAPPFEELLSQLEEKVDANPQDQQGLFLLAQTYSRMGRFEDSAKRYQQLIKITEPSADLYAGLADVQAMAADQVFSEEISDNLDKALTLDPQHVTALWLGGLAKQQLGQPESALRRWLSLQPIIKDNAEASQELSILIEVVSQQLGAKAGKIRAEFANLTSSPSKESNSVRLTVKVSLDPALLADAKASDTVFVYAKAKTGPPMPLAASRQPVSALPFTVTLDDSMAMLPDMKLSSFQDVLVGARISTSGQAIAQSGDLESDVIATQNTATDTIELIISKRKL